MTGAFKWSSLLQHFLQCLPNLSLREEPLLPVLDVFGAGWVWKRPFQGAATSLLPKMTEDPTYCSWTPRSHRKQDQRHRVASLQEQGVRHRSSWDPLNYRRQASDSQRLTCCVSPEEEARPCHICSRNGHCSISLQWNQRLSGCV